MPDKVMPGPVDDSRGVREAVCIHTRKIYDSSKPRHGAVWRNAVRRNPAGRL